MKLRVVTGTLIDRKEPILVGIAEGVKVPSWVIGWPSSLKGPMESLLKSKRFQGKLNETFLLPIGDRWLVLVGIGKQEDLTLDRVRQAAASGSRRALAAGMENFARGIVPVPGATTEEVAQAVTEGTILGLYR